jgi:hypothetical protein
VLIADSFPFSNEGLRLTPAPGFLLWAKGDRAALFDETHLGIESDAGVTVLMREFRLHGFVVGCILLATLWIWRNSAPLVPPVNDVDETYEQSMEGKTAREAIMHLLRKHLSSFEALRVGLEAWSKVNPPRFYWETIRLQDAAKLVTRAAKTRRPDAVAAVQRQLSELLFPKRE